MKKLVALIVIVGIVFGVLIINDKKKEEKKNKETQEAIIINNEARVLEYFEDNEEQINKEVRDGDLTDKAKEKIVELTDFIFYDKEINGIKYSELKEETKEKLIDLASKIDNSVEKKVPNYKERIKEKYDENFPIIMDSIKDGITFIDDKLEEKIGKEKYDSIKEKVSEIKDAAVEKTKEAVETVKDGAQTAKSKIKDWYEGWK